MKTKTFFVKATVLGLASLLVIVSGCTDSSTQPTSGQISMSIKYSQNPIPRSRPKSGAPAIFSAIDSIKVVRARLVLSRIRFKTSSDSANFRTPPVVLDLDLSGLLQTITVSGVPFGTYGEIEFKVNRVDSSDLGGLSPIERASLADFLAGDRYSIIVDGIVYHTGASGQSFTYRSRIDEEQRHSFGPELVVSATNSSINVTMAISSSDWFRSLSGGILDPSEPANESQIENNLKSSIKIFEDNDRNGERDHG